MEITSIPLIKPTNRAVTGPKIKKDDDRLVVEYDYQRDDGGIDWAQVIFHNILSFEYRDVSCCKPESVVGAGEVRCVLKSDRLSTIIKQWQNSVGWQEWQQKQGGAERFKHFTIYFDDAACIDVIAGSCETL
jgi:hypothetical protein